MLYFQLGGVGGDLCLASYRTFSKCKTRRVGLVQGLFGDLSTCLQKDISRPLPLRATVLPGSEDAAMSQQVEPQKR